MFVSVLALREEAESGLVFLGLLVMENSLKQETKPVLQELTAARIRSVMVTGKSLRALRGTQQRGSLLQHPPLHGRGLHLGCHHAMEMQGACFSTILAGDNLQTAVTVAKNAGMIHMGSKVILVEANEPEGSAPASIAWRLAEDSKANTAVPRVSIARDGCFWVPGGINEAFNV